MVVMVGDDGPILWVDVEKWPVPLVLKATPLAVVSADVTGGAASEIEQAIFFAVVVPGVNFGDDAGTTAWF